MYIEVKNSNIPGSGQGLFTTRRIKKGSIITRYIGVKMPLSSFKELVRSTDDARVIKEYNEYAQGIGNDMLLVGSGSNRDVEEGVAHLVNDGGVVEMDLLINVCRLLQTLPTTPPISNTKMAQYTKILSSCMTAVYLAIVKYLISSYFKRNIVMGVIGEEVYAVADRDLLQGDEMFHSYGVDYWMKGALQQMCIDDNIPYSKARLPKILYDLTNICSMGIGKLNEKQIWDIIKKMTTQIGVKQEFSRKLKLEHLLKGIAEPLECMKHEISFHLSPPSGPYDWTEPVPQSDIPLDVPEHSKSDEVPSQEQEQEPPCPL